MVELQNIPKENRSEVARLRAGILAEYQAAQQGLSGLAQGIGQHAYITKRMENIADLHAQLRDLVDDETMEKINLELDRQGDETQRTAI